MADAGKAPSGQALVIGGGAIGRAVLRRWEADGDFDGLWLVGRSPEPAGGERVLTSDHSEASISACCESLAGEAPALSRVVITLGTLHGDGYAPEKALRDLREENLAHVLRVNCVLPLLWLAGLSPLLRRAEDCRVVVLSARVGSIADNRLGGWYSYRSAKAALNMGLKCAAIELARSAPGVKLIAYHPGTVDSPLSQPFQARVKPEKLFTPERAANCLLEVMERHGPDGELAYLDWAGERVAW